VTGNSPLENGKKFIGLMRRYVQDYTNCGNQDVTRDLMEPDYILFMGDHVVQGRDESYHAATAKQMRQFPGLGLTVHEIATTGERLAMRFSEHGASRDHEGKCSAWSGIALYKWNGTKLTSCWVEQDYWSRRTQLAEGRSNRVQGPAIAPWDTVPVPENPEAEARVRDWLASGSLAVTQGVLLDDQWEAGPLAPLIEQEAVEINDLFSCGNLVAFHAVQKGRYLPGDGLPSVADAGPAYLHLAGMVNVSDAGAIAGNVIRNRIDLSRRLRR